MLYYATLRIKGSTCWPPSEIGDNRVRIDLPRVDLLWIDPIRNKKRVDLVSSAILMLQVFSSRIRPSRGWSTSFWDGRFELELDSSGDNKSNPLEEEFWSMLPRILDSQWVFTQAGLIQIGIERVLFYLECKWFFRSKSASQSRNKFDPWDLARNRSTMSTEFDLLLHRFASTFFMYDMFEAKMFDPSCSSPIELLQDKSSSEYPTPIRPNSVWRKIRPHLDQIQFGPLILETDGSIIVLI